MIKKTKKKTKKKAKLTDKQMIRKLKKDLKEMTQDRDLMVSKYLEVKKSNDKNVDKIDDYTDGFFWASELLTFKQLEKFKSMILPERIKTRINHLHYGKLQKRDSYFKAFKCVVFGLIAALLTWWLS
jgi:uridine kinase